MRHIPKCTCPLSPVWSQGTHHQFTCWFLWSLVTQRECHLSRPGDMDGHDACYCAHSNMSLCDVHSALDLGSIKNSSTVLKQLACTSRGSNCLRRSGFDTGCTVTFNKFRYCVFVPSKKILFLPLERSFFVMHNQHQSLL
jgi:hypothetical protein